MALTKSDKMDMAGARTPADIEQKYNFGKSFAKAMGLAEDARDKAEEALEAAETASNIDYDTVFKKITENYEKEGVFNVDGHIYINGSRIKMEQADIDNLFANNINMSGTFTHTVDAFLYPGEPELEALEQAILANETVPYNPLWDFNSDGEVDVIDPFKCRRMMWGLDDFSKWDKAVKTPVTLTIDLTNPDKAICITGTNMWGRDVEMYIGASFTNIKNPETEQKISDLNGKFPSFHNGIGGADYETVVFNWDKLPNGTWNCYVTGIATPYAASAFGYRIDDYGAFVFMDYNGSAKFITVGVNADGAIIANRIRDI